MLSVGRSEDSVVVDVRIGARRESERDRRQQASRQELARRRERRQKIYAGLAIVAGPYNESHAHQDQGSFTLFSGDWLAVTANI